MAMLVAGCGEPALLTFDQYLAQCSTIRGKPIQVAGYIGTCAGYDCLLFADEAKAHAYDHYSVNIRDFAQISDGRERKAKRATLKNPPRIIGIGRNPAFDSKAASLSNNYVVISGRVDRQDCTGEGGLDRIYGVMPTDIRAWTQSEGAPATSQ